MAGVKSARRGWRGPAHAKWHRVLDTWSVLAGLHVLALAMGLGGVWSRGRALHDSLHDGGDPRALRRAFVGEGWWGAAAILWLSTGLWSLFGRAGRGATYYAVDAAFYVKMVLFVAILALEVWPMTTLIRWRFRRAQPNVRDAGRIEAISYVQCAVVVAIVFASAGAGREPVAAPTTPTGPSTHASTPAPRNEIATGEVVPVAPSGTETVTSDDLALLAHELAMPLSGIDPDSLRSNFDAPRAGGLRRHEALDIMAPRFTPIHSAAKGRVLKLFTSVAGGLMVYAADSSERFILMYAHLDHYAAGLRNGQSLERGQLIGYVGSTGNASANAPHLHFGILRSADVRRWSKGKAIDPLPVLRAADRYIATICGSSSSFLTCR